MSNKRRRPTHLSKQTAAAALGTSANASKGCRHRSATTLLLLKWKLLTARLQGLRTNANTAGAVPGRHGRGQPELIRCCRRNRSECPAAKHSQHWQNSSSLPQLSSAQQQRRQPAGQRACVRACMRAPPARVVLPHTPPV